MKRPPCPTPTAGGSFSAAPGRGDDGDSAWGPYRADTCGFSVRRADHLRHPSDAAEAGGIEPPLAGEAGLEPAFTVLETVVLAARRPTCDLMIPVPMDFGVAVATENVAFLQFPQHPLLAPPQTGHPGDHRLLLFRIPVVETEGRGVALPALLTSEIKATLVLLQPEGRFYPASFRVFTGSLDRGFSVPAIPLSAVAFEVFLMCLLPFLGRHRPPPCHQAYRRLPNCQWRGLETARRIQRLRLCR